MKESNFLHRLRTPSCIRTPMGLEEGLGFEPKGLLHPPVFKTGAISRTLPSFLALGAGIEPAILWLTASCIACYATLDGGN